MRNLDQQALEENDLLLIAAGRHGRAAGNLICAHKEVV